MNDFRSDEQQITKDAYDQLSARYNDDPASLSAYEKAALLLAGISDMLATEAQIKQLTIEVNKDFQGRCDRARVFLDKVLESTSEPADPATFWQAYYAILPERLYDVCLKVEGLANILPQVYELGYRAEEVCQKRFPIPDPEEARQILDSRPVSNVGLSPERIARRENLERIIEEEKQLLVKKGYTGDLDSTALMFAIFRSKMGDEKFNEYGMRERY